MVGFGIVAKRLLAALRRGDHFPHINGSSLT